MLVNSFILVVFSVANLVTQVSADKEKDFEKLMIGITKKVEDCTMKVKNGDVLKMHYRGTLRDGTEFDSSYGRGDPFSFTIGKGMVIRGWDTGILDMCVGEKRRLRIPSSMGYGASGSPPKIPGGSGLIFDVELLDIQRKDDGNEEDEDL